MLKNTVLRLAGFEDAAEPIVGRNTAPAVTVAALKSAVNYAESGKFITFGIVPSSPETGCGYIKALSHRDTRSCVSTLQKDTETAFPVESFVEKPDFETARNYINSGNY